MTKKMTHSEVLSRTFALQEDIVKLANAKTGHNSFMNMAIDCDILQPDSDNYLWTKHPLLDNDAALNGLYSDHKKLMQWLKLKDVFRCEDTPVIIARHCIEMVIYSAHQHFDYVLQAQ